MIALDLLRFGWVTEWSCNLESTDQILRAATGRWQRGCLHRLAVQSVSDPDQNEKVSIMLIVLCLFLLIIPMVAGIAILATGN